MQGLLIAAFFVVLFIFVMPTIALIRTRKLRLRLEALEHKLVVMKRQMDAQSASTFGLDSETSVVTSTDPNLDDDTHETPGIEPSLEAEKDGDADFTDSGAEDPSFDETDGSAVGGSPPPTGTSGGGSFWGGFELPANFEQALGAKWAVWVGGVAMALGGIFLVRYAAEQGLLGPGVRIFFGALLATVLAGTGEWLRRKDEAYALAGYSSAYVPGVLTAAAIISAFATVYAAYALYNFLDPLVAFALLAAISFLALFASWLHGPWIAGLGILGSYGTPALVSSEAPSAWTLYAYLLIVTVATYPLARVKNWVWLAKAAAVLAFGWGFIWLAFEWSAGDLAPHSVYVLGLLALGFYFLSDQDHPPVYDWTVSGILALTALLAFPPVRLEHYSAGALTLLAAVIALLLSFAWLRAHLARLVPYAALLFGAAYVSWHIPTLMDYPIGEQDEALGLAPIAQPGLWHFLASGLWFATAIGVASFLGGHRHRSYPDWMITAAAAPVVILAYAYFRATDFSHSIPFAATALGLAALYLFTTEYLFQKREGDGWEHAGVNIAEWGSGVMAAASVSALALALTMALDKGWLTMALALICPGLAYIAERRPVPKLRYLAAAFAAIVAARLIMNPVVHYEVGTVPIFNWLLYGYGVPMAAFGLAAYKFRSLKDHWTVRLLEGAAVLFLVVLTNLQIRHLLNDGDIFSDRYGIAEAGLQASSWLALSIGLQRLQQDMPRTVLRYASTGLACLGLVAMFVTLLFSANPLFTGESLTGVPAFNTLIPGYLIPAALCGALYYVRLDTREDDRLSRYLFWGSGIGCLVLLFVFASLELRAFFHWPQIKAGFSYESEQYAYSALWLVLGGLLLWAGTCLNLKALRLASLIVVGLTVCKVFLFDMAGLTGIWRALSFIGLGGALLGIGYFYQRYVFPKSEPDAVTKADTD